MLPVGAASAQCRAGELGGMSRRTSGDGRPLETRRTKRARGEGLDDVASATGYGDALGCVFDVLDGRATSMTRMGAECGEPRWLSGVK